MYRLSFFALASIFSTQVGALSSVCVLGKGPLSLNFLINRSSPLRCAPGNSYRGTSTRRWPPRVAELALFRVSFRSGTRNIWPLNPILLSQSAWSRLPTVHRRQLLSLEQSCKILQNRSRTWPQLNFELMAVVST